MSIHIEKQFSVAAAPDTVWAFLTDPRRVARCLPGASITEQLDDKTYGGQITVKVGPVSGNFKGKISFKTLDAESHTAELLGAGQDVRGKGGANMTMTSHVDPDGAGSAVSVVSEVNVTGILAQFGRGMIQEVSDQMFQTFTAGVRRELEGGATAAGAAPAPPAAPQEAALNVVALGTKVGGRLAGRLLRQPAFWFAVVVIVAIGYWLFGR